MQSIQVKTIVGEDGILQVQMPPEIKQKHIEVMIVFQNVSEIDTKTSIETKTFYNAWGNTVTEKSVFETIKKMKKLRQEIKLKQHSIFEMIQEGRRF